MELRLIALWVLGTLTGSLVNLAIYRLRFNRSDASPWTDVGRWFGKFLPKWLRRPEEDELPTPDQGASGSSKRSKKKKQKSQPTVAIAPRSWADKIPVWGWYRLRREEPIRTPGFWIRPLIIELALGCAFAWLYWWEVENLRLVPPPHILATPPDLGVLWSTYLSHLLLLTLMFAASFIDIDDQIIPDEITVPGTLIGLTIATLVPQALLPVATMGSNPVADFLKLTSPQEWPTELAGGQPMSLGIALAAVWIAAFALLPRIWRGRRGWRRAIALIGARIKREAWSYVVGVLAVVVSIAVAVVWNRGGEAWEGLLSSLAGMAVGGGLVWMIRLIGAAVLRREAMGFGDVTLMAMIGSFLGWQPVLLVFFIGPIFGVIPALAETLLRRQFHTPIPYGPYLCLGAVTVMICWSPIWAWAEPIFGIGWLIPAVMLMAAPLMAILLGLIQLLKRLFARSA